MKLEIHSFESILERAKQPFEPHTALISIGDPDAPAPQLLHKPENVLRLVFDDITHEEARDRLELPPLPDDELELLLAKYNTFLFTDEMAQTTAQFIIDHAPHTDKFICQCEFGQSRSAVVAAALAEFFGGHGKIIFMDKRYSPNIFVYRKLLEAMQKLGGDVADQIDNKTSRFGIATKERLYELLKGNVFDIKPSICYKTPLRKLLVHNVVQKVYALCATNAILLSTS